MTRAHVLWCTCGAHVCRVGLCCAVCVAFLFRGRDAVCVTMSRHVFARTPSLKGIVTHICPSALPSPPGAAQSDPDLRELSPMRSRTGRAWCQVAQTSHGKPSLDVLWPCHFSRLLEPGQKKKRSRDEEKRVVTEEINSECPHRADVSSGFLHSSHVSFH